MNRFEECKEIVSMGFNKGDATMCVVFYTYDEVEITIDIPIIEFLSWFDRKTVKRMKDTVKEYVDKL